MKAKSALLALLLSASAASATTVTLFHETFDGNNQNWSYSSTGSASYDHLWTETNTVKPGYKGVKLGSTSVTGGITSEAFVISNTAADVSIVIVAAAYQNNGGGKEGIAVTVYDSSNSLIFSDGVSELTQHSSTAKDEIPTTATFTHTFTVPAASIPSSGGISMKIESTYTKTGQRRALLGDVLVTQTYSSGANTPPAATQASVGVNATVGTAASLDLADYFSDTDGDTLAYAVDSGVGTVSGSTWTFTPDAVGSFSAVVSATDPSSASATMTIAVTAVSAGPASLDAPANLAASSIAENGFSLVWDAVEHAAGYAVEILDGSSAAAGSATVSGTGATVTGLSADTEYTAKVKATAAANSPDYEDSSWSDAIVVKTTLAGGLLRATLFDETFDHVGGTGWGNSGALQNTDESGWTTAGNVYRAPEGLRLGTGSNPGAATTREIAVSNAIENAEVVISFLAASYAGKKTAGTLTLSNTVSGAETKLLDMSPPAMSNGTSDPLAGGTNYEFTVTVPARFALRFESLSTASDKRLLLDSIKVTQVYDPAFAALAAPTGVAGSDIGKYGFTVSWNAVSNATSYEVWLDGSFHGSCASTFTSMQLTGLSDGTAYSVQVKALGDNLHFGDSPLSTAISVTTLADAQKIDFTVTGAPAGDVFAGDAVSFTVTAENEATHTVEPVSFAGGIAGATFTAGAFLWTPTESDVGSHTATFTSGSYSTNVAITVVSAFVTTNLFHETFTNCTTKWSSSADMPVNGASSKETFVDEPGWTFIDCLRGMSGLKMGTEKAFGTATTRAIEPLSAAIPVHLSFRAAAYVGKTDCSIAVSVSDTTGIVFSRVVNLTPMPDLTNAIPDGAAYEFGPFDVSVSGEFTLAFTPSTGDGRMGVDNILATQTVSAKMQTLAAPTGLAVVGEAGETGFTVGWTAVANATNYAVRVTDVAGTVVFSAPFCAASPIAVTGLADDVSYTVQVRATGDESLWFASPWSDALVVHTKRSALHPTLSFGPWTNAAGEMDPVATLANTAPVSAALDGGADALVEYVSASPEPDSAPTFAAGTLCWTPAETDAEKTFALTFTMAADEEDAPVYTTNVVVSVGRLPETVAPAVTVANVSWNSFELRWEDQYRASDYLVRVWTGTSDPDATGTEYGEYFEGFPSVKPDGWTFDNGDDSYPSAGWEKTRLAFKDDGSVTSPELSGSVTNLSFEIRVDSGSVSVLTVEGWNGTAWVAITNFTGETLKTEKKTISGLAGAYSRFRWTYAKNGGKNCGLGSIVFSGTGLPTARFLPGWETPGKSVGKVTAVTVAKPVPGRFTGRVQNPQTGKWEDAGTACVNYAEVTVVGTDGKTASAVVAVPVPYLPRSARATMLILR